MGKTTASKISEVLNQHPDPLPPAAHQQQMEHAIDAWLADITGPEGPDDPARDEGCE